MSFTSPIFAVFVAAIFVAYYAFGNSNWQITLLVLASLVFYSADNLQLLPILVTAVAITYATMLAASRGSWLGASLGIAANLSILAFFKYKLLIIDPEHWQHSDVPWLNYLVLLPLPIGISFFVFHNISAIVDHYKVAKNPPTFLDLTMYIIFFPQLVSGPITRASGFFPQIEYKHLRAVPCVQAAKLLILGYFMKLYAADNLSEFTAWMAPETMGRLGGGDRLLMVFLYSCQIYADFLGYSTIALGLALLFGYRLPINFNLPYTASSFSDFWNKWHISLSTWLRVYLYIPLGGSRGPTWRTYLNLLIVMGLGGLWHGASLNYLAWGLYHGLLLVGERMMGLRDSRSKSAWGYVRVAFVFVTVSFAWLLFRFTHLSDAVSYVGGLRTGLSFNFAPEIYLAAALSALPVIIQHVGPAQAISRFKAFEPALYGVMLALAIFARGPTTTFIYFRF